MSGNKGEIEIIATIKIRYHDVKTTHAVSAAVSPDNVQVPLGITVGSEMIGETLNLAIASSRGIRSLVATVDDLLSCVQAAERAIRGVRHVDQHQ